MSEDLRGDARWAQRSASIGRSPTGVDTHAVPPCRRAGRRPIWRSRCTSGSRPRPRTPPRSAPRQPVTDTLPRTRIGYVGQSVGQVNGQLRQAEPDRYGTTTRRSAMMAMRA
jgi:hypothetical protein